MVGIAWVVATVEFLLELAALAALGVWGWHVGPGVLPSLALAAVLPLVGAVLWGLFAAPRRRYPSRWGRPVVQLAVFGGAAAATGALVSPAAGVTAAVLVLLVLVASHLLPTVGREPDRG